MPPNDELIAYRLNELDNKLGDLLTEFKALAKGRAKIDVRLTKLEQRTNLIWAAGGTSFTLAAMAVLKAFGIL